jgi:hypothetical protein
MCFEYGIICLIIASLILGGQKALLEKFLIDAESLKLVSPGYIEEEL